MILYYIRHGQPIYEPDSLTPFGKIQAEAVCKCLAQLNVDRIYSSTSNRAIQTAMPLCELLNKEPQLLDFCKETYAWEELTIEKDGRRKWLFQDEEMKLLLSDKSIVSLGFDWYKHPRVISYKKGIQRIYNETDNFLKSLGYEHIRETGRYRVIRENNEKIALFAHQGFGLAFFSVLLDIPYPVFANHFDMCHTGMTVVEFKEESGFAIPKILTFSSDAHLFKESLSTNY